MKKAFLILSSLICLTMVSCTEKQEKGKDTDSFSKAEVVFEVLTKDLSKPVSSDFWNYVTFKVEGKDFGGAAIDKIVNGNPSSFVASCTTAPTAGKDLTTEITVTPVLAELPEKVTVDYCVRVRCVTYDKAGKVLDEGRPVNMTGQGTMTAAEFALSFKKPVISTRFALYFNEAAPNYRIDWKSL